MSGFAFDAKAALHQARKCQGLPTRPTLPTDHPAGTRKVGTVGKEGTMRASDPEMTPDELARDIFEERAAIRQFDGGQDRETAERAAWSEAWRSAGMTALDDRGCEADDHKVIWLNEWKAAADDVTNPDAWR